MDELIAKLEAATEGSRELSAEILTAIGWSLREVPRLGLRWFMPDGQKTAWQAHELPLDPARSLDAALTLVPEGWCAGFENAGRFDANPNTEAWCWPFNSGFEPDWRNGEQGYRSAPEATRGVGTPAIALCIASLKARSPGGLNHG